MDDVSLLSRYLVEENDLGYIRIDKKRSNDIIVVKSVLRNLLENYKLLTLEEERNLHTKIHLFFDKFGISI